jgi:hypothetical protein
MRALALRLACAGLPAALAMACGPALAAPSGPTESGLAHCAAIGAADARLACYDELAQRVAHASGAAAAGMAAATAAGAAVAAPPAVAPSAVAAPASVGAAPAPAVAAPAAAATSPAPKAATAAAATAAPAQAVDPSDPKNFGLSAAQLHTLDQAPKSIEARIVKTIVDANLRGYVVLDNGQTWALTEGEMLFNVGDTVTVSRAALGSFMMSSAHHSYHVRRVK